jgi:hypothetical protein
MQVLRKARIIVATAALGCAIAIAGAVQRAAAAGDDVSPTDQYKVYCAKCHGPSGHGDGANASTLKTRPRDFSDCATMSKISDDSTVSRPFDNPESGKIAIKVINHYGDEVLKIFQV